MSASKPPLEALDLTHVLYDPTSNLALALALATLSPILLMANAHLTTLNPSSQACYGALTVVTRDFLILNMWIGQLGCEAFNYILKHAIKQERPSSTVGGTYGFPSSHSQFMGYFASYMLLHLYFRHRFVSFGIPFLDLLWASLPRLFLIANHRFHLGYHTPSQILWGLGIGVLLGIAYYGISERIPFLYPKSIPGRLRKWLLGSPLFTWLRIVDGWAVWTDGGHETKYKKWREMWNKQKRA
ncbi:hypothetical protein M408DRAFT_303148 [Serendipita vermifera MAFF 305830]|uniref:Phosphatidic acid phosphatase type 2/haloperoxidase domain-containing protein n=1 Tax=Serendipita vermifera MAFF 305830 TaxID=933852 RepID=A0A0C3BRX2_SERVB|nr:hypothetical protein M408DRAFT_303148 [Serendipita vermifera MAFF 305830]